MSNLNESPKKNNHGSKYVLLYVLIFFLWHSGLQAQEIKLNEQVYVQIKTTKLRKEPKLWAEAVETLNYADTLTVVQQQGEQKWGDWLKVSKLQSQQEGFVHKSAIRGSKILLAATNEAILNTSAEDTDVFLAGKGFSSGVLDQYVKNTEKVDPQSLQNMKGSGDLNQKQFKDFVIKGKLKDV